MKKTCLLALLLGFACAPPVEVEQNESWIVNGTRDTEYRAVGLVGTADDDDWRFHCSGTVVGPTTILTSAHCLFDTDGRRITARRLIYADDVYVYDVVRSAVAPHYDALAWTAREDAAVLSLGAPSEFAPLPMATVPPDEGQHAWVVGYGVTSGRSRRGFGVRRRASITLDTIAERELVYSSELAGPCYGDSGGPILIDGRVVGVTSRGTGECRGVDFAQRADVLGAWVRSKSRGDVCLDECP